jgi:WD40 repeat protein
MALCVLDWCGGTAFATVRTDRRWAVRIWNLQTGEEFPTDFEENELQEYLFQLRAGEEDKTLYGLTVYQDNSSIFVAFASKYSKVLVVKLDNEGQVMNRYLAYKEWPIPHSPYYSSTTSLTSCKYSRGLLLAAGTEDGHLAIWNLRTGEIISAQAGAHLNAVTALQFHPAPGQEVLVSGGGDGVLRFWTDELRELFAIEIGERVNSIAWVSVGRIAVGTNQGVLLLQLEISAFRLHSQH